jgi:hypothetical protein
MTTEAEFEAGFKEMCEIAAGLLHLTVYHKEGLLERLLAQPEDLDLRYDMMALDRYITAISNGQDYHCLFCEHVFALNETDEPAALGVLRPPVDAVLDRSQTDMPVLVQGVCPACTEQHRGKLVNAMADFFRGTLLPNARLMRRCDVHAAGQA